MKKKIIILSSFIILFLVSLLVYTKAENSSNKQLAVQFNWSVGYSDKKQDYNLYDFIEQEGNYVLVGKTYGYNPYKETQFIRKYNNNGAILWNTNFTNDSSPEPDGIINIIEDDSYLVAFHTLERIDSSQKNSKYFISKFDQNGDKLWEKEVGSLVIGLSSTTDGFIVLYTNDLIKYNNNGDEVWKVSDIKDYNASGMIQVIETTDGYVTLGIHNRLDSDESDKDYSTIIKYDHNGKMLWTKQYDSIKFDKIINSTNGSILISDNNIIKLDEKGDKVWEKQSSDYTYNDIIEIDNGYIVVGNNKDKEHNNGIILKYDLNGDIVWENQYDNYIYYIFNHVTKVGNNYYVIGASGAENILFIYNGDGKLINYKRLIDGEVKKIISSNNEYIILTSGFLGSYSIKLNEAIPDKMGSEKVYKLGDMVEYQGQRFFVIEDSNSNKDYVTLLKSKSLTSDEIEKYKGNLNISGDRVPYYTSDNCYWNNENDYKDSGCTNNYKNSFIQQIIENWAQDTLNDEDLVSVDGYKTRSITVDELINNLGYYYGTGGGTTFSPCLNTTSDTPWWGVSSAWTMSSYGDGSDTVYGAGYGGGPFGGNICADNVYEVSEIRPVINLKKSAINDIINNDDKNNLECNNGYRYQKQTVYKSFKVGDEIEYNHQQYYVIENSNKDKKYITLLKAEPLTKEEINEYNDINYQSQNGEMPYYLNDNCNNYSNLSGCINDYNKSNIKQVVDKWAEQFTDLVSVDGYKARLITDDELRDHLYYESLSGGSAGPIFHPTNDTPTGLYNNDYSYWMLRNASDDGWGKVVSKESTNQLQVFNGSMVRPVINLDKCAVDGGCYEENVAIGCKDDKTVVNVPSTLKMVSKILLIISSILIIGGICLITFNYIKAKHERK